MAARTDGYADGAPLLTPGVYIREEAPESAPVFRTGVPAFIGFMEPGRIDREIRALETTREEVRHALELINQELDAHDLADASHQDLVNQKEGYEQDLANVVAQIDAKKDERGPGFYQLTAWEQFEPLVGRAIPGSFLAYAVRGFFENGGECCTVVPLRLFEDQRDAAALRQTLHNVFTKSAGGVEGAPGRGMLADIEETDLVCVPDIMMEGIRESREVVFELQRHMLEYCQEMGDRFGILDSLPRAEDEPGLHSDSNESTIAHVIAHWQELVPTEGALYFPWIRVEPLARRAQLPGEGGEPPRTRDENHPGIFVPPCGHVAGIYARNDTQVGVHKAPANAIVEGAMDVATQLTNEEQSRLNDIGVNCLRSFPGRGIRVWGARTLSGLPPKRYVNVRRLFLTLVRWIERSLNDLVFEPNGPPLWNRVRDRLGAYCYDLFKRGALKGHRPAEAFFVKCDAETNPLDVREKGELICEVGLAPVMPAEFIVVRITQSAAGASATIAGEA